MKSRWDLRGQEELFFLPRGWILGFAPGRLCWSRRDFCGDLGCRGNVALRRGLSPGLWPWLCSPSPSSRLGGPGRAEAVGGLAGPTAHRDRGLLTRKGWRKCWKTPLKGQAVGAARLPGAPGRWDRGRGSTRPVPGLAPAPAVPAVTQDGQSGASAGEPEKRGRDPRRLHRLPRPFLCRFPPATGAAGRAWGPGGTAGLCRCWDEQGRGHRAQRSGAVGREFGSPSPAPRFGAPPVGGGLAVCPSRAWGHSAAPVSPCLFSRLSEGTVAAHIWAALGAAREQPPKGNAEGFCLQGRAGGEIYALLSGTELHKSLSWPRCHLPGPRGSACPLCHGGGTSVPGTGCPWSLARRQCPRRHLGMCLSQRRQTSVCCGPGVCVSHE